jgi:hypothetical protein
MAQANRVLALYTHPCIHCAQRETPVQENQAVLATCRPVLVGRQLLGNSGCPGAQNRSTPPSLE